MNKKITLLSLLTIAILFSFSKALAQRESFIINDTTENGSIKFRRYDVSAHKHRVTSEKELLTSTLGVSPHDDLVLVATMKDSAGYTHKFYQQYYKGIKVEHGNYATHSIGGDIAIINGEFAKVGSPGTQPSLKEAEALALALQHINAQQYKWQTPSEERLLKELKKDSAATYYPKGEIVICYDYLKTKTYKLAYKFAISGSLPLSSNYVYIDAINGNIVAQQNLLFDVNTPATITTKYNGVQTIVTDQYVTGGVTKYRLQETRGANVSIQTFNSQQLPSTAQIDFTDANNTWTASNNTNMDNAALDAHWAMEKIYDYWSTVRGLNSFYSIAGFPLPMISFVHYNTPYQIYNGTPQYHSGIDNASWDGSNHQVIFGDGYLHLKPVTSIDAVAHEFGHGFTEGAQPILFTSGGILINADHTHPESLALNEGISDIWGAVIESWATTGKQTWRIGEDIMKDGKPCLRSLENPKTEGDNSSDLTPTGGFPDTYHGTYWDNNNASHTNATVIGHWFYLLSQGGYGWNNGHTSHDPGGNGYQWSVTGIGISKAAKILWYAEQNFLGANSQYADARTAMITAATNLFCNNSQEVASVTNAWYAVGVGAAYTGTVPSLVGTEPICTTQTFTVQNPIPGATTTWSSDNTSGLTVNASGLTTRANAFNGGVNLNATLGVPGGCSSTVTRTVQVGAFNNTQISIAGTPGVCQGNGILT